MNENDVKRLFRVKKMRVSTKEQGTRAGRQVIVPCFCVLVCIAICFFGCAKEDKEQEEQSLILTTDGTGETVKTQQSGGDDEAVAGKSGGEDASGSGIDSNGNGSPGVEKIVYVYVCGAVGLPGVYALPENARIDAAVNAAGGLRDDASPDAVNLAQFIADGQQIYVPTKEEVKNGFSGSGAQTASPASGDGYGSGGGSGVSGKVNINTAGESELMSLTGIGSARARAIIEYREKNGRFGSADDLLAVEGIGAGILSKIRGKITF